MRDSILGIRSKDIDFSVEAESYAAMRAAIVERCGGEDAIKVEHEEFVTIRAIDPKLGGVDFVLCRKEGTYSDGRRPDSVEAGTLLDDLARRDFTMNAIARAEDGTLIDPFNGQADIACKLIRCVGDARQRFMEDRLRVLRAIRFSITKGFTLQMDTRAAISEFSDLRGVSVERVREELLKCFECNTIATLQALDEFPLLKLTCFSGKLFLKPTIKP